MPLETSYPRSGRRAAGRDGSRISASPRCARSYSAAARSASPTASSRCGAGCTMGRRSVVSRARLSSRGSASRPGDVSCAPAVSGNARIATRTPATTREIMRVQYTPASRHAHLIAQLVAVVGPARVVLGERLAELPDRPLERLARGVLPELLDHQVAHAVPVTIADAAVDALVADDRQAPLLDGEVDQHPVSLGRLVHAEPPEHVLGSRQDVGGPPEKSPRHAALQMHSDLRRRARLGGLDRPGDRVEIRVAQEPPGPLRMPGHHQLPLAPPPPELPPPPEKPPPEDPPPPPPPQPPPYQPPGPDEPQPRRPAV